MSRLSDQSYEILRTELDQQTPNDAADRVRRQIVIKRLEKMRFASGEFASETEITNAITDIYPDFNPTVIQRAAKANRPPGLFSKLKWVAVLAVGSVGFVYIANLPYPMIRRPVAKTMPMVLLPSFLSMDHSYREAVALVEQADQLVNQATSAADLELGTEKVTQAQKHLDKLPVWFLGYYPEAYCTLFGCTWRFTYDEFKAARQQVARMEAKLFQENNAQTGLNEAIADLEAAKQQHQQAQSGEERSAAIAQWQGAIDRLVQIPSPTLAGRSAQLQLEAARRDFQAVVGTAAGSQRSGSLLDGAKAFALQAAQMSQNPPHNEATWEQIVSLWQDAISRLDSIPPDNPSYVEAQTKLAEYKSNIATAKIRLENERNSVMALDRAKELTSRWQSIAANNPDSPQLVSILQDILNQLDKVEAGTTATEDAEDLRKSAKRALDRLG
ncbi:hypothetical protein [Baaleninema sp.]|uniref:hypothetical protein n=1 Tax=Baaleninema sp. TaxID=3101197 RepID=UPI003CFF72F1